MRSIKRRFNKIAEENPALGYHLCLKLAVAHQRFSEQWISRAFNSLVPEDDYGPECKKDLIDELVFASNEPEDDKK